MAVWQRPSVSAGRAVASACALRLRLRQRLRLTDPLPCPPASSPPGGDRVIRGAALAEPGGRRAAGHHAQPQPGCKASSSISVMACMRLVAALLAIAGQPAHTYFGLPCSSARRPTAEQVWSHRWMRSGLARRSMVAPPGALQAVGVDFERETSVETEAEVVRSAYAGNTQASLPSRVAACSLSRHAWACLFPAQGCLPKRLVIRSPPLLLPSPPAAPPRGRQHCGARGAPGQRV